MATCRNDACGCEATADGLYCEMCEQFRPICPVCNAVYGEHRQDCTVADGYDDCGEGPWDTEEQATDFANAEVGMPWQIECSGGKWYVLVKDEADDDTRSWGPAGPPQN